MEERAKIKAALVEKLKSVSMDEDFICGVISNAKNNDDRKAIIEYIEKGENVTYEQILLLSVWLGQAR
jgi:uncharacterized coiled-coil DUF342 family protein